MAKIVSPVWSSIRGSIAGITYLTTPSGAIIARQRVTPVNAATTRQTQIRGAMAAANAAWLGASAADRIGWDSYALATGYANGRQAFIAGYSLASYLNTRFGSSIPLITDPPTEMNRINIYDVKVEAPSTPSTTGIEVQFSTLESEDTETLLQTSLGFNQTRNYWKGPWDESLSVVVPLAGAASAAEEVICLEDKKYFVRLKTVVADGPLRVGNVWYASGIGVATGP